MPEGTSLTRPILRLLERIARPDLVFIRARNPCCRILERFEGWYVLFITTWNLDLSVTAALCQKLSFLHQRVE